MSGRLRQLAGDYDGVNFSIPQCTLPRCASLLSRCGPNAVGIATTYLNAKVEDIVSRYERHYCKRTRQGNQLPAGRMSEPLRSGRHNFRNASVPSSAVKPQRQSQKRRVLAGSFVAACYGCSNSNYRQAQVQPPAQFSGSVKLRPRFYAKTSGIGDGHAEVRRMQSSLRHFANSGLDFSF